MTKLTSSWRQLAAVGSVALLAACASHPYQQAQQPVPQAAPAPAPMANSQPSLYQVDFQTNRSNINAEGQQTIRDVGNLVAGNYAAWVTIVGRTDTAGSASYNKELSERRATAVRDALVGTGKIPTGRIETAWTGQEKQAVGTVDGVSEAQNRVVDIYVHFTGQPQANNASNTNVFKMMPTSDGRVLSTDNGMTLYTYDRDNVGQSQCYGECAEYWPPFLANASAVPSGNMTLVSRLDGKKQWASNGMPLYTFVQDKNPGDVEGNNYHNNWHVVR
jgi:predicted lipoprotein with Yx(FWY)xxD motif